MNDLEMLECSMKTADPTIKEELIECISSGQSKKYLGKEISLEDLDKLSDENVEKLYAIYRRRLTTAMANSLGDSIIRACSHLACMVLTLQGSEKRLTEDLSGDPFLNCTIRNLSFKLYYKCGGWMSLISMGMIIGRRYLEDKPQKSDSDSKTDLDKAIVI